MTLSGPVLARLSDLLAKRIGLYFPEKRWEDLERGVTAVAPAFGAPDTESCARRLLSFPLTHREIEILASRLTIGETYFYRDKRSLDIVEQRILPELLQKRRSNDQRLRIWSAGCCTGEEPYSVAMLLDRLIPDTGNWNITLLGTDINPEFLGKAARGEYGEWSFRDAPDWIRQRYFRSKRGGRFEIDERIRARVRFSCLNLAEDSYPSLTSNTNAMDVIFCRNVLMYFTPQQAKIVVEKLYRSLVDGGWLIVSPAEVSSSLFSRFTAVQCNGVTLYRKGNNAGISHRENPPAHLVVDPDQGYPCLSDQASPLSETMPAAQPPASPGYAATQESSAVPAQENQRAAGWTARDLANQGRLEEAAEQCQVMISADKLNPALYYLLATIRQEQGQIEVAEQSLARALYLDSGFVLAYFALGNLHRSQGKQREARKHFDNALDLLRAIPADQILPESEGLTAGRLGEIIESTK